MYHQATLPNGLRIVGETLPYVRSVSVGLWVNAGSRDEEPNEQGISHLIEHMLFKGTQSRTARQIAETIDAIGGQINAFTTREYTCYYAKTMDNHLDLSLEILADMLTNSLVAPEELAKEKRVVLEEIRSYEDAPDELVHDLVAGAIWPDHPLGRSILGTPDSVAMLDRELVNGYLQAYYRPDNTVLAAAGHFDFTDLCESAERLLGSWPAGAQKNGRTRPSAAGTRVLREKDTEQVNICLAGLGVSRSDPDKYAVMILDSILGASVSSRLFQKLREERGLVYAAGSIHSAFYDTGLLAIYAGTSVEYATEVVRLIMNECADLIRHPVSAEELERAKEHLRGGLLLSLENTSTRMSRLAKAALFEEPLMTPEEISARMSSVTAADVMRSANRSFNRRFLPAAVIAPPRAALDLDSFFGEGLSID